MNAQWTTLRLITLAFATIISMGFVLSQSPIDFDQERWHDNFCYGEEICLVGDFDGIGGDDIIAFVRSSTGTDNDGNVWVALAGGDRFHDARVWYDNFCYGEEVCGVGDFDGDGRDDIIAFVRSSTGTDNDGNVWVALSDGRQFTDAGIWHDNFCYSVEACLIGDFNGDGRDDIAAATGPLNDGRGQSDIWVALSDGTGFVETRIWGQISGCELLYGQYTCLADDFDGDGDDDIMSHDRVSNSVRVVTSEHNAFSVEESWLDYSGDYPYLCNRIGQTCDAGDFNNDGIVDVFTFVRDTSDEYPDAVVINGSSAAPYDPNPRVNSGFDYVFQAQDAFCIAGVVCRTGDVNDDGLADIIVFYRSRFPDDSLMGDVFVAINRSRRR